LGDVGDSLCYNARVFPGTIHIEEAALRFELLTELGRGATGTVYKAHDRETGDIVAVKQLKPEMKFPERELLLARKVTHPNVCRVFDLHREAGHTYLSMEYVEGQSLAYLVRDVARLPLDDAMQITAQILDGLEAAHRQGVIHRDLKPANILIALNGTAKLVDFGIAWAIDPERTLTAGVSGTPAYMAPEQMLGRRANPRTDIYSLGIVLYELFSGRHPLSESLAPLPESVPPSVQGAILRCMEKDPAHRFGSVGELRSDLIVAQPIPARYQRLPQWRGFLIACAVLTIAVVLLVWQFGDTAMPNVQSAPATEAPVVNATVKDRASLAILIEGNVGAELTRALVAGGRFRVVERPEIEKVLSEMRLNNSGTDVAGAQRVGHLLGAAYLMFGSSQTLQNQIRINARLIRTETGEIVAAESIEGAAATSSALCEELARRFRVDPKP
jgi:TolB-like protein